ncbi:protein of unknown function DUF167 [Chloroherpeton thalassium ATCC 35110]|uniref:UPF0235 protein Ctha_0036 n=1 Tax=Chloroherpeton thalassium (strain ATCC 35110 / GB-78) TaxID=517418 RepID=B3QSB7_CHLT3|nr:DUF167 domain-containing protein [Chloroherpeton thalassium]ACF12508.1 protein of unknown function DUF167 [Chloroherpeton thalassium ATCC 35110]
MISCSEKNGAVDFSVRLQPRASKNEIVGEYDGALKIRIAAPPVENAANKACIEFLAKTFGIAKSQVEILSGDTSRNKLIRIYGIDKTTLLAKFYSKS